MSMRNYFSNIINKIREYKIDLDKAIMENKPEQKIEKFPYENIIKRYSYDYNLDEVLIRALIQTESSNNERAYRFEPVFYDRYIKNKSKWLKHPYYNQPKIISASLGLTQIMLTTALEFGLDVTKFEEGYKILYNPDVNIGLGCKILRSKINKYGPELGILAYNSGSPRKGKPELEHNYIYLQKIAKNYKKYGGKNPIILKHAN